MKFFNDSLSAVVILDAALAAANETYKKEKTRVMETLRNPTEELSKMRKVLTDTEEEQKRKFREVVKREFEKVRNEVNEFVISAPPEDFHATFNAVSANAGSMTDYEVNALLEKYRSNYLAYRTLHEAFCKAGKEMARIVYPDHILKELEKGEELLLKWAREWKGSQSYMSALLKHNTNPITALEKEIQQFFSGTYNVEV